MYVCICSAVTEQQLKVLMDDGATYNQVESFIKKEGGCCKCLAKILEVYGEEYAKAGAPIG